MIFWQNWQTLIDNIHDLQFHLQLSPIPTGSLSKGMESSMTIGMFNHISIDVLIKRFFNRSLLTICLYVVYWGDFLMNNFNPTSLDVWGVGPGFEDTATTFSVCTWLMIYYVVSILMQNKKSQKKGRFISCPFIMVRTLECQTDWVLDKWYARNPNLEYNFLWAYPMISNTLIEFTFDT